VDWLRLEVVLGAVGDAIVDERFAARTIATAVRTRVEVTAGGARAPQLLDRRTVPRIDRRRDEVIGR